MHRRATITELRITRRKNKEEVEEGMALFQKQQQMASKTGMQVIYILSTLVLFLLALRHVVNTIFNVALPFTLLYCSIHYICSVLFLIVVFTKEFQEIMDNMASSSDPSLFDKLSALASDFT